MDIDLDDIELTHFPDGQPHIKVGIPFGKRCMTNPGVVDVSCRIRNPEELFKLLMLNEVILANNYVARLHIRYLMGARMDRAIGSTQPFTLKTVCETLNCMLPDSPISVFCPHSDAVSLLLKNYKQDLNTETLFYVKTFEDIIELDKDGFTLVLPDAGAGKRWYNNFDSVTSNYLNLRSSYLYNYNIDIVECSKKRDMQTGKLSSFRVFHEVKKHCVILDDLCDGGRTFIGLAEELRKGGAETVDLVVCHAIFSHGQELEGIDKIYTTNSYKDWESSGTLHVHKI
jgi:ribose-phosphate pyrophosphokinase